MNEFQQAMSERGHVTHVRQTLNTWRLSLDGGLSGTLSRFSKTQARQVRNFLNRFDKGDFALRHASKELPQIDFFIAELIRLHQLNWNALGQPGCFTSAEFRGFFEGVMQSMLPSGDAEIVLLEREGRAVAGFVWLLQDNIGFGYQCGRDPAEDEHRVGRILQAVSIRDNCQAGLVAFDYLRGDEDYKQQLRATPTVCQRLRVVARTRMSELRHSIWATCREVRSLLKRE
jgi:CelD/BcsL family acetyltransferase involved in cellulose biosynthesis